MKKYLHFCSEDRKSTKIYGVSSTGDGFLWGSSASKRSFNSFNESWVKN